MSYPVLDHTRVIARLTGTLPEGGYEEDTPIYAVNVPDLLDLLMAGEDPKSGRRMTTAELRDNLLTFIIAGHETTALTLAWALYLCAFDPAVQSAARDQARGVLGDRAATAADVAALPLIRRIVDEALRLYPPAAFLSRTAQARDHLCGHPIQPGDTVILPIYALHRHHALWRDPETTATPATQPPALPMPSPGPNRHRPTTLAIPRSWSLQKFHRRPQHRLLSAKTTPHTSRPTAHNPGHRVGTRCCLRLFV